MPQFHLYVKESLAKYIKKQADSKGMSVSKYLAEIVKKDAETGWPEDFFSEVIGGWKGEPLRRARQGEFEKREDI